MKARILYSTNNASCIGLRIIGGSTTCRAYSDAGAVELSGLEKEVTVGDEAGVTRRVSALPYTVVLLVLLWIPPCTLVLLPSPVTVLAR